MADKSKQVIYKSKNGQVLLAIEAESLVIEGRKVYSVDEFGVRTLRVSVNDENEILEKLTINENEAPADLLTKAHEFKIKAGKLERKTVKEMDGK